MSQRQWLCVVPILLAVTSVSSVGTAASPASQQSSTSHHLQTDYIGPLRQKEHTVRGLTSSQDGNRQSLGSHRRAQADPLGTYTEIKGHDFSLVDGPCLSGQNDSDGVHVRTKRVQGCPHVAPATPAAHAAAGVQRRQLRQAASNTTVKCLLEVGGISETFTACTTLSGTPGAYTFHWSLLSGNRLRVAIDSTNPGGYTGWGVGSQGGSRMVPGNGVIVKADAQAPSGASVADYHLGGYRTREVTQPSSWTVTETKAAAQGNRLLALFTLQLEADEDVTSFPVIYTQGAVVNGQLQPHDSKNGNTVEVDLTSSLADIVVEPIRTGKASSHRNERLSKVHGWLNGVGLGLLLPLAGLIARTLRERKAWFNLHWVLAVTGIVFGVIGIGTGYYMRPFLGSEEKAHAVLGTLVLICGLLQVVAGVLRPKPEHKRRHWWAVLHHSNGKLLIIIVVVNYYIGVHMSTHLSGGHRRNWYVAYSLALGVIVALGLAKEIYNATVLRRRQQAYAGAPAVQMSKTPAPHEAGDSRLITDGSYSHQHAHDIT